MNAAAPAPPQGLLGRWNSLAVAVTPEAARLWGCIAVAALAFHQPLLDIARIGATSSAYHHVLAAPILAIWVAARDTRARAIAAAPDFAGVAIFLAAAGLAIVGAAGGVALLEHAGAVLAIIGAATTAVGRAKMAAWIPALVVLAFTIPFGEVLTPALQASAAIAVEAMLGAIGVAAERDHLSLSTRVGIFEIAEACAGLRFLTAAMLLAALAAALFFTDWRKRLTFLAAAAAIAILANWIRATLIVAIAVWSDRRIGVGADHLALGWVLYAMLIAGLVLVAYRWRDTTPAALETRAARRADAGAPRALIAAAAVSFAYGSFIAAGSAAPASASALASDAHAEPSALSIAGWREVSPSTSWRATIGGAGSRALSGYWSERYGAVTVDRAEFAREGRGAEIAGWGVRAADGDAWRAVGRMRAAREISRARVQIPTTLIADRAGAQMWTAPLYRVGERFYHNAASAKAALTIARLSGQPADGTVMFVASDRSPEAPAAFIASFISAQSHHSAH